MKIPKASKTKAICLFNSSSACFGGAQWIQYPGPLASRAHHRHALVKLPGQEKPVRVALSRLPKQEDWNAFNIADAAEKYAY
jgi:hypothetical protein